MIRLGAMLTAWVVLLVPASVSADVYKWEDEQGVIHFTQSPDEVPPQYRGQMQRVTLERKERSRGLFEDEDEPPERFEETVHAEPPDPGGAPEGPLRGQEEFVRTAPRFGPDLSGLASRMSGPALLGTLILLLVGSLIAAAVVSLFLKLACRLALGESPTFLRGMGVAYVQMITGLVLQILVGVAAAVMPLFALASPALIFLMNTAVLRMMLIDTFAHSLLVSFMTLLLQIALVVIFMVAFVAFASYA